MKKGRGARINTDNRFHQHQREHVPELEDRPDEEPAADRTEHITVFPKTIINQVDSPDIPLDYSMNPYQGCEHGCVYCYARNTHSFWGYSAGLDFEQKILIKKDAPAILEKRLRSKNWKASPIMLAGNTDCYQPAEKTYQLTRQLLEILWKYRHPVGLITKNKLILRDLDLLEKMAKHQLVRVAISVTTLDEKVRRLLEPRTATAQERISTIRQLNEAGIPVNVMAAPIIPGLTEHEVFPIAQAAAAAGAWDIHYTLVRLNGDVETIFLDWLQKALPDRAQKIENQIRDYRGGQLGENRFGKRMSGEGLRAEFLKQQFALARKQYFADRPARPAYNLDLYEQFKNPQMKLFD